MKAVSFNRNGFHSIVFDSIEDANACDTIHTDGMDLRATDSGKMTQYGVPTRIYAMDADGEIYEEYDFQRVEDGKFVYMLD